MQIESKLTLDGLMTSIAGLIAFIAVMIQIRSSSKQLRDQIKALRDAERGETERQKRAIAAALLAEVTDFCDYHIEPFIDRNEQTETVKFLDKNFAVYEANTARIGELDMKTCEAIIHFYDFAREHVAACHRYLEIAVGPPGPWKSEESKRTRETKFFDEHLEEQKLNKLKELAKEAERMLAQILKGGN